MIECCEFSNQMQIVQHTKHFWHLNCFRKLFACSFDVHLIMVHQHTQLKTTRHMPCTSACCQECTEKKVGSMFVLIAVVVNKKKRCGGLSTFDFLKQFMEEQ